MSQSSETSLEPISSEDKAEFIPMAVDYFTSLNPSFIPNDYWKENYFEKLQSKEQIYLEWILNNSERVGFAIYGTNDHIYLEKKVGMIYDFYVRPDFRNQGIAKAAASIAIERLQKLDTCKMQIEVADGNEQASLFWEKLGFQKISTKYSLA